jgi:type VI secretion system secreted protein VgrG
MPYTQDNRKAAIKTPLGKDVLLLESFSGGEQVSQLFRFDVTLLAEVDKTIDFNAIVGQPVTIRTFTPAGDRHFHGIVSRFSEGRSDSTFTTYHAEVVPWLWMLTQTADCRIFRTNRAPTSSNRSSRTLASPTSRCTSIAAIRRASTACSTARPTSTSSAG